MNYSTTTLLTKSAFKKLWKKICCVHFTIFGVTDFEYNGQIVDDTTLFSQLVTDERVSYLIEKIEYYGYSGEAIKGLIFCSRREEAIELSNILNMKGYRTVALTGSDSQETREHCVTDLESGNLDYILTVDIFLMKESISLVLTKL
ncbi:helicase-related protein [Paenibacillus rhizoplanae]